MIFDLNLSQRDNARAPCVPRGACWPEEWWEQRPRDACAILGIRRTDPVTPLQYEIIRNALAHNPRGPRHEP